MRTCVTTCVTTGPIRITLADLEAYHRSAWGRMWDDLGHLAGEEMPEEHVPFIKGIACACFPCRAWEAYRVSSLPVPAAGRNEPCPCQSGRKYKRCHGK